MKRTKNNLITIIILGIVVASFMIGVIAVTRVLPHSLVIRWYSDTLILPQAIAYYSVHTWYA